MLREFLAFRPLQMAAAFVALSLGIATWTAARALRIEPVPNAAPPTFATEAALAKAPIVVPVDIPGVVANNVFSPERTAPARRYRLSGYAEAAAASPPRPEPVVIGTSVADGGRSFAFCSVGGGPPRLVRVGESIEGYVVRSIERSLVVFTTPAGERLAVTAR
jgi:hypothetical protein